MHFLLTHLQIAQPLIQPDLRKQIVGVLTQQLGMKTILTSLLLAEFKTG